MPIVCLLLILALAAPVAAQQPPVLPGATPGTATIPVPGVTPGTSTIAPGLTPGTGAALPGGALAPMFAFTPLFPLTPGLPGILVLGFSPTIGVMASGTTPGQATLGAVADPAPAATTAPTVTAPEAAPAPSAAVTVLTPPTAVAVPEGVPAGPTPLSGSRISLNLRDADVVQALGLIFQDSGASYVLEPGVTGRVNVALVNVTREQALAAVLQSANLGYRRVDGIYYIGPAPAVPVTAPTTAPQAPGPAVVVQNQYGVIRPRYLNTADIALLFGGLIAPSTMGVPGAGAFALGIGGAPMVTRITPGTTFYPGSIGAIVTSGAMVAPATTTTVTPAATPSPGTITPVP